MRAIGVTDPMVHLDTYIGINTALWAAVERHELTPGQVRLLRFEQLTAALHLEADPAFMADEFVRGLAECGDLYPGARAVLDELAATATLALVTNGLSEVQRTRIERLGLQSMFAAVVISAEVGTSKPATSFFDIAFEQLGTPERTSTLMVGDSLSADVRGGADYGTATCWYNPHERAAPTEPRIDHVITTLAELPAIVRG